MFTLALPSVRAISATAPGRFSTAIVNCFVLAISAPPTFVAKDYTPSQSSRDAVGLSFSTPLPLPNAAQGPSVAALKGFPGPRRAFRLGPAMGASLPFRYNPNPIGYCAGRFPGWGEGARFGFSRLRRIRSEVRFP